MPPVVLWVLGAVGAFAAAKWVVREARRINAELHPELHEVLAETLDGASRATLRRDPSSGIYRPD